MQSGELILCEPEETPESNPIEDLPDTARHGAENELPAEVT